MSKGGFNSLFSQQSQQQDECRNCKRLMDEFEELRLNHLKLQEDFNKQIKDQERVQKDSNINEAELKRNRSKIEKTSEEITQLKEKNQIQQGELDRANLMIKQLKEVNEKLQKQKEDLLFEQPTQIVTDNDKMINNLQDELRQCLKQKEDGLSKNTELLLEIQQLRGYLTQQQRQLSQSQHKSSQSQQEINKNMEILQLENNSLKQQLNQQQNQFNREIQDFQKQIQEYENQIRYQKQQLDQIDQNIDNQQNQNIEIGTLQLKYKQLQNQVKMLMKQNEFKDKKIIDLKEDIEILKQEIEQISNTQLFQKQQSTDIDYQSKYNELNTKYQQEIQQLNLKYSDLQKQHKEIEYVLMTSIFNIYLEQGSQELLQLRQENQKIKLQLAQLQEYVKKDDIIQQKITITNLKKQLQDYKVQLESVKDQQIKAESEKKLNQEEIIKCKCKIAEMMNLAMEEGGAQLWAKFASLD